MVNYKIVGFDANTGIASVQFENVKQRGTYFDQSISITLPVVDGLYPTGEALNTFITEYYERAEAIATPVVVENAQQITELIYVPPDDMSHARYWYELDHRETCCLSRATALSCLTTRSQKKRELSGEVIERSLETSLALFLIQLEQNYRRHLTDGYTR